MSEINSKHGPQSRSEVFHMLDLVPLAFANAETTASPQTSTQRVGFADFFRPRS